jgi:hypothetical protein
VAQLRKSRGEHWVRRNLWQQAAAVCGLNGLIIASQPDFEWVRLGPLLPLPAIITRLASFQLSSTLVPAAASSLKDLAVFAIALTVSVTSSTPAVSVCKLCKAGRTDSW